MTMKLALESGSWAVERNGKMHFKQEQLFHLHRLSLLLIKLTGQRLRFRTRNELEHILTFAGICKAEGVKRQLDLVRSVLPFHWNEETGLESFDESPYVEADEDALA